MRSERLHLNKPLRLALMVLTIVGGLAILMLVQWFVRSHVDGTLKIDDAEFSPDACEAGRGFFGVELHETDATLPAVVVVVDPSNGPTLRVEDGKHQAIMFAKADCETLLVTIGPEGSETDHVWHVGGHFAVECRKQGRTISGRIELTNCH